MFTTRKARLHKFLAIMHENAAKSAWKLSSCVFYIKAVKLLTFDQSETNKEPATFDSAG